MPSFRTAELLYWHGEHCSVCFDDDELKRSFMEVHAQMPAGWHGKKWESQEER